MRIRRSAVAALVALALAATLSGCQTIGSIADKVLVESAMRDLKAQLEAVDGVTAVYAEPQLHGDYSYTAAMTITATEESTLSEVIADVKAVSTSELFARNTFYASLALDVAGVGTASFSSFALSEPELTMMLSRWHAVAEVLKVPVSVYLNDNGDGTYSTQIGTADVVTSAQLEQLSALQLPQTESLYWSFPGLEGSWLPDAEGRAFFETITAILPPLSYAAEPFHGVTLSWSPETPWYLTIVLDDAIDGDPTTSPSWPLVKRELAAAIESGRVRSFTVQLADDGQGGTIHLGQCAADVTGLVDDVALLQAFDDVKLPEGSGAGWC
jgi:hypothetical protein